MARSFRTYYYKHDLKNYLSMPCGKKRKRHKIATHKRKKRLRKNRHKKRNK
jgi:hypothetical protein